jgi:hypothetical protein
LDERCLHGFQYLLALDRLPGVNSSIAKSCKENLLGRRDYQREFRLNGMSRFFGFGFQDPSSVACQFLLGAHGRIRRVSGA